MSDDDNIIEFKPLSASTFPRVERHRSTRRECPHRQTLIDEQERTIECKACGEIIDPIHALLALSRDWEHIKAEARAAEEEAERLNRIVDERKKARDKVSRAREARADCIEIDEDDLKRIDDAGATRVGEAVLARLRGGLYGSRPMLLIEVKKKAKVRR